MVHFICQVVLIFIRMKDVCIICKMLSFEIFYAVVKVIDVNKAKKRIKNWALRNSCPDYVNYRAMVINQYKLFSIGQIRIEPVLCNVSYPIVLKFANKYLMINYIKCFFQVYKYTCSYHPAWLKCFQWWTQGHILLSYLI